MGLFRITKEINSDPVNHDIIFASVGTSGKLGGKLAQFVMKSLKLDGLRISPQELAPGYYVAETEEGKFLVLVVTVGTGPTANALAENLPKALRAVSDVLPFSTVWMPPMGVGGGGLLPYDSLTIILDALFALRETTNTPQKVVISLPSELKRNAAVQIERLLASWNDDWAKFAVEALRFHEATGERRSLFAVEVGNEQDKVFDRFQREGIWESEEDLDSNRILSVNEGDLLLAANATNTGFRLRGLGWVVRNYQNRRKLRVNWRSISTAEFQVDFKINPPFHSFNARTTLTVLQQILDGFPDIYQLFLETSPDQYRLKVGHQIAEKLNHKMKLWHLIDDSSIKIDTDVQDDLTVSLPEQKGDTPKPGELLLLYVTGEATYLGVFEVRLTTNNERVARSMLLFSQRPAQEDLNELRAIDFTELVGKKLAVLSERAFREILGLSEVEVPARTKEPVRVRVQNDGASGKKDLLEIEDDVRSMALLLAASDIEPPLAIALFGRWGAGKSFFMKMLKTRVNELSENQAFESDIKGGGYLAESEDPVFCKNIAQIEFNAWSYMDANLWAGLASEIFEKLNEYLEDHSKSKIARIRIEEKLEKRLTVYRHKQLDGKSSKAHLVEVRNNYLDAKKEVIKARKTNALNFIKSQPELSKLYDEVNEEVKQVTGVVPLLEDLDFDRLNKGELITQDFRRNIFTSKNALYIAGALLATVGIVWGLELLALPDWNFTAIVAPISAFGIKLRQVSKRYQSVLDGVSNFNEMRKSNSRVRQRYESAKKEYENLVNDQQHAEERIKEIPQEINELKDAIREGTNDLAIRDFITNRSGHSDYKTYQGLISIIRKDFETLSELFMSKSEAKEKSNVRVENITKDKGEIMEQFKAGKKLDRIILYIDDLDRCDDHKVLEVIQAVHLLMAFPLFHVVVGVDKRCVTNALLYKTTLSYRKVAPMKDIEELGIHLITPAEYLEKIFQVPFELQEPSPKNMQGIVTHLLEGLVEKEAAAEIEEDLDDQGSAKPMPESTSGEQPKAAVDEQTSEQQEEIEGEPKDGNQSAAQNKVTRPVIRNVAPADMKLKKEEPDYLRRMLVVVGNTPRTAKRFVNIYYIIRSHAHVRDEETSAEMYLMMMFLLAMRIGQHWEHSGRFFTHLEQNKTTVQGAIENVEELRDKHEMVSKLTSNGLGKLLELKLAVLSAPEVLSLIRRFSFAQDYEKEEKERNESQK